MEFEEEDDEVDESESLIESTSNNPINPEDYILSLYITDNLRQIFILVLLVGNFLSINFAIVFMCLAWYVKISLNAHITFLQDFYQPHSVPAMLGISGLVMLGASLVGLKAAIGGRMADEEDDMKSAATFFFIYSIAAAVAFGAVFIAALTCFIEIATLSSAFGDGMLAGMKKYIIDAEVKPELDDLQNKYKCCGSDSFKDWYKVAWIDAKYLDTRDGFIKKSINKGQYFGKDVPYSCCKWSVMRPCVDARIEDPKYHSKYKFPDDLTLNKMGCREAVTAFLGHTIFQSIGLFVLCCSLLWMAMTAFARYLNTSMTYLYQGEPPIGWLIPYVNPKKSSSKSQEEDEETEPEEEVEETEPEETETEEDE